MFIQFEGSALRVPLQKILTYKPSKGTIFPIIEIKIDATPPEIITVEFNTDDELNMAMSNMDRLCSVIKIPKDHDFDFSGPPPEDEEPTLQ